MKKIILLAFVALNACSVAKPKVSKLNINDKAISYRLSMPEPQTHYFEVEMNVISKGMDSVIVKLPVWAPGSYLIREFAKNVDNFSAINSSKIDLKFYKKNKNTWVIKSEKAENVTIKYSVYANEISVRTSFIDADHGYLNGTSIFMYVPELKNKPTSLEIIPFENWKTVSTGLNKTGNFRYDAENYDVLVDSPIEIGNHKVLNFEMNGISHHVAMVGGYSVSSEVKLLEDLKTVCLNSTKIFNENPCSDYTFIVQHYPSAPNVNGGGLEHLNSTTLIVRPDTYQTPKGYQGFLSLAAHEYFHLWNVKRIRPEALGPFDYDNENYTNMLWVAEGFTSFYQDNILRKGNLISENEFISILKNEITTIENQPGNKMQSVTESSFDAWIKYYRQNENSRNSTISYYDKGGLIGAMLNLMIIENSKGSKNLDDVYQLLWKKYKTDQKGYSDNEFKKALESIANVNLNDFYNDFIIGTKAMPYNKFLNAVGLKLDEKTSNNVTLGANIVNNKITSVLKGSSAYIGGLNFNDEFIDVDGQTSDKIIDYLKTKKEGEIVTVKIKRFGQIKELKINLINDPLKTFEILPLENQTESQKANYKKWMHL